MSGFSSPFNSATPPPPPPKQSSHASTPLASAPRPPPPLPPNSNARDSSLYASENTLPPQANISNLQDPEPGWLPDTIRDKSTADLHALLTSPDLQQALIHAPYTAHPSTTQSIAALHSLLATNLSSATALTSLEARIADARQATQSRLLALRALEAQWRARQAEQEAALRDFSAGALYQRLSAAGLEGEQVVRAMEESFLEGDGVAGERETAEFVRRVREARKIAYLRRERRERWDEGRVGGWRG
ncbi:hypothetical protein BT63DRAFT_415064 [Microthyrium microscopicum]|uniref:VPS37 C-terminal domain-containing protein n=1 Tax=Microthyrium microscopicum TaxID=703497 RepID=A0A6A6U9D5_9PEZI|nr:hypothetical protein BT63DRAFT_415064 [Microthyrium microscopicum]